ncbi:cytochrome P450 [Sporosarcina sp. Marseille-Q4063]|uniref:cytochrome P450 n=1 Tax=Sporosarcina sp. Marseille-Q4063 TaxID=2810514 RepID=UPI001BAFDDA9|nr:cytochrome P450 [Sporosarcina sp. Marseille-Q4063]QUW22820.1 cytochrome P450 [Sporosarcina sp. Marseille-Q4063]
MEMPKVKGVDNTFNLLTTGYPYIFEKCKALGTEVFETRLMGKKMICMTGKDAVTLFYDSDLFQREGAVPKRIQKTLFGQNGVQTMDGEKHKLRKLMFLSLMTESALKRLGEITTEQWRLRAGQWKNQEEIVLFDETEEILCRVACLWAGVPLKESEVASRAYDFGAMIDAIGGVGPRYQEGKNARQRTECWIRTIIENYRNGSLAANENTAIHTIATHRDESGNHLNKQIAAVELINILRPIVAVARFVAFGALALHDYPINNGKLKDGDGKYLEMFVQEVRRFYPFAPFLGAMVRQDFQWKGFHFKKGTSVLIDLHGVNHDPELWNMPYEFQPDRFNDRKKDLYDFVPQGGGDPNAGHRCPGEEATVVIMKSSLSFLVNELQYDVPDFQDLSVNHVRLPTLPKNRFVIRKL